MLFLFSLCQCCVSLFLTSATLGIKAPTNHHNSIDSLAHVADLHLQVLMSTALRAIAELVRFDLMYYQSFTGS